MHPGQSVDFSYTSFRRLLYAARSHFSIHRLSEAPNVLPNVGTPILFLRHDIKLSLNKGLRMAEIEHEHNLSATYLVRPDSPLYSLNGRQARIFLLELVQMGHEVGLHFDLAHETGQSPSYLRLIEAEIRAACERIEQITCRPVRSLSLQRPIPLLFGGHLLVNGLVNADAGELRRWCISDSGGSWRNGNPISQMAQPGGPVLQMILHPIWWGDEDAPAPERLQEFFDLATREQPLCDASIFDINLAKIIPAIRRQGISALASERK
ncbi:MAG TPA: hypothetical protein VKV19_07200 [Ktedonobacteraceae bacterium]|nr:hypothetical protein [Ktedonobacteraceae bacterium]